MIKGLIFDLDNTLYNEDLYFLEIFRVFSEKYDLDFEKIRSIFTHDFRLKSKDIFTDILKSIDFYHDQLQEELFYLYNTINIHLPLYDDAKEILKFSWENGLKTAIVTNGVLNAQKNKIRCLGIEKFVDFIVYAREFGRDFEKPHKKAYEKCLHELGLNSHSVLFIGDDPLTDISGASKCGIRTVFIRRGHFKNEAHCANYEIDNLMELIPIIERGNCEEQESFGHNRHSV